MTKQSSIAALLAGAERITKSVRRGLDSTIAVNARTWNQKRSRPYGSENLMAGQPGRSKPA